MHDIDRGQRVALRAKLLLGVAGATAAASTAAFADQPTAPPADPQKWAPYSDFGGSVGSGMVGGKLDFFVPVFQNLDSLAFLNLGVGTETKANVLYNIGAGYRTKIDPDWIVGIYAGHDGSQLEDNNTFGQTSFSAELMSADWDVRLNAYLADNAPKQVPGASGLYINGTTIAVLDAQDVGYSGFDGEVGYRVFSTDDTDVRVFVGGFHFSHGNSDLSSMGQSFDFGYRDMSGAKARAEATVYDLDIIGNQSRLTVDGQIAHDDVRGTTGSVGVTLRIPLGSYSGSSGAQALDELDRRMIDPVRHNDQVLTRSQYTKPEPVIIYGPHVTSQPTNTLLYVDGTTTASAGTYAHPTTLADAASRHTTNAFIVLDSKAGPIPGGVTLQPGQTLVPGGSTFTVEGEFSHAKFTHLFDPSTTPTLIPAAAGGDVLTLANNTSLYGFNIEGNFGDAVYGKNVDHVSISHVTIDGTGGGVNGINIQHTVSGEEIVNIDNVAISNVTADGILLRSNLADGGSSTEKFTLSNITVANAGDEGIQIYDTVSSGSKIINTTALTNITISNAGIGDYVHAYGNTSAINQTFTLSDATVSNPAYQGVVVGALATGGASVVQSATLSNIAVTSSGGSGIAAYARAFDTGSTVNQTFNLSNATVTNAGYEGIEIGAQAFGGATVSQTVSISNATVSHVGSPTTYSYSGIYGIGLFAEAYGSGSTVKQSATLSHVNVSYVEGTTAYHTYSAGIGIRADAYYGGHVVQTATLSSVTSTKNEYAGLLVVANASDYGTTSPTTVYQNVSVTGGTFTHNAYGVQVIASATYDQYYGPHYGVHSQAAISQYVSLTNVVMDDNETGLLVAGRAENGASLAQGVTLYNVDISHNIGDGVRIIAEAEYLGSVTQSVTFNNATGSYNTISYNGGDGIYVGAHAGSAGEINQHLYVYATNVTHNGGDGVQINNSTHGYYIGAYQIYYSHLQQNLIFAYGAFSNNAAAGISIDNSVSYGAAEDQLVELYGVSVTHNGTTGFSDLSYVTTYGRNYALPTTLTAHIYIEHSNLSNNVGAGASIKSYMYGPYGPTQLIVAHSALEQYITVANSNFSNNGSHGLVIGAYDYGLQTLVEQVVTISGSTFDYNAGDGLHLVARQAYGTGAYGDAIQSATISNSDFSYNTHNGLYALAGAYQQQGRAEQYITVTNSTFNYNGANGIYLNRVAENGVYVSGFPCFTVQNPSGGCAFVRQTFSMEGGSANYNGGNGLYLRNYASDYGSIYGKASHAPGPTVFLYGVQFNGNGNDGLYSKTEVYRGSFAYNFIEAIDTTFNGNVRDGFHTSAYAGYGGPGSKYSVIVEKNLLYSYATGTTANNNGRYGVNLTDNATGGSYLISSNSTLGIYGAGITVSGNASHGVYISAENAFFFGTGYVAQNNTLTGNTITSNGGDGLRLSAFGPGVGAANPNYYQFTKLVGNTITSNTHHGVYGYAAFGAYSKIDVYAGGNTVTSNGAGQYGSVTAFGGSVAFY